MWLIYSAITVLGRPLAVIFYGLPSSILLTEDFGNLGQPEEESKKRWDPNAYMKYSLNQTSGVYIVNKDIGKVKINLKEFFLMFVITT